ncbi:hypothetical protein ADEAN_000843500 [Angomonas deanei]|uniref:BAR domain containing protein n=1 Tax=Angomonas deanei TaxID=59799 RepID=A0A7G2CPL8_9TRYP|nr:hypothetical protein ADEAN_000843500 [Angomonas deanei]
MNTVHTVNRRVKLTLKLAPKTEDEEYNARKKSFKSLSDSIKDYKNAMDRAKKSIKGVVDALSQVQRAFTGVAANPDLSPQTSNTITSFGAALDRLKGEIYENFEKAMDTEVSGPINGLREVETSCNTADNERTKFRKEYDLYRDLVRQKEAEYTKKDKDLSASKSYGGDVIKMNENQKLFEEADLKFTGACSSYTSQVAFSTTQSVDAFMRCWRDSLSRYTSEFAALASASCGYIRGGFDG